MCPEGSPIYYEMVLKMLENQYLHPMTTANGKITCMAIVEKIAYARLSEEIDNMLMEANEIELDTTKVQSFKRVANLSERHHELLSMLLKFPDCSRRELAVHLGWSINMTTPRVKELIDLEKIKVSGAKHDEKTDRNVETLVIC